MNRSALAPLSDGGLWGLESTQLDPGCLSADNGEVIMGRGKAIGRQVDQDGNFKSVTENNLTILIKQSVYVGVEIAHFYPTSCCWWLPFVVWSICLLVKVLLTEAAWRRCSD